jgi:hypothetical protein
LDDGVTISGRDLATEAAGPGNLLIALSNCDYAVLTIIKYTPFVPIVHACSACFFAMTALLHRALMLNGLLSARLFLKNVV